MIRDSIAMALRSLLSNRVRALLTMIGIIVGVAAVIAVVSIGEGGKDAILGEFRQIGSNMFMVEVDERRRSDLLISEDDLGLLRSELDGLEAISAILRRFGSAGTGHRDTRAMISGIDPWYTDILELEPLSGRLFTETDHLQGRPLLLISETTAEQLFNSADVVGRQLRIGLGDHLMDAQIVGVIRSMATNMQGSFGGMAGSGMGQMPGEIYMPLSALNRLEGRQSGYSFVLASSERPEQTEQVADQTLAFLRRRHSNATESSYRSYIVADILDQIDTIIGYITAFIAVVAGISLVVGGIGVMNIMLVSVTERTREIGIRRAIGARMRDILLQILTESVILTLIGGILGIITGLGLALIVTRVVGFGLVLDLRIILIAVAFSSAVGLFFGLYPAYRASRLDPIAALRHE